MFIRNISLFREIVLEFIFQRDLCFHINRISRVFSKPCSALRRASVTDYFIWRKSCIDPIIVAQARLASVMTLVMKHICAEHGFEH